MSNTRLHVHVRTVRPFFYSFVTCSTPYNICIYIFIHTREPSCTHIPRGLSNKYRATHSDFPFAPVEQELRIYFSLFQPCTQLSVLTEETQNLARSFGLHMCVMYASDAHVRARVAKIVGRGYFENEQRERCIVNFLGGKRDTPFIIDSFICV